MAGCSAAEWPLVGPPDARVLLARALRCKYRLFTAAAVRRWWRCCCLTRRRLAELTASASRGGGLDATLLPFTADWREQARPSRRTCGNGASPRRAIHRRKSSPQMPSSGPSPARQAAVGARAIPCPARSSPMVILRRLIANKRRRAFRIAKAAPRALSTSRFFPCAGRAAPPPPHRPRRGDSRLDLRGGASN